jgi:hypothetical protein
MYDPDYKLKHRPPSTERLIQHETPPEPMIGDPYYPPGTSWEDRCKLVYDAMMRQKRCASKTD